MNIASEAEALAYVQGKPASFSPAWGVVPSIFGQMTLSLFNDRIVEQTKIGKVGRNSVLLLSELDSVEFSFKRNPLWLLLGVLTLLFFVGIIFFIVYFFSRQNFLIIRSKSNVQIVWTTGEGAAYYDFMNKVIQTAIGVKKQ